MAAKASTPFHLILRIQQDDKRLDVRRASAGLAVASASERNTADGREAVGHKDVPGETYLACGGAVKVIACTKDPVVIEKILTHLKRKAASAGTGLLPASRAPP